MKHSFHSFAVAVSVVGVAGVMLSASITPATAELAQPKSPVLMAKYTYSSSLVQPYTSGCIKKLTAHGKTPSQAASLCQCSITQMQQQHSQSQAIMMLTKAQFSASKDPNTGLPSSLSKFFTPCLAKQG